MKNMVKKLLREHLLEVKAEPTDSMVVIVSKGYEINLYDLENRTPIGFINISNNEVSGVAAKKGYGPLIYELGMAYIYPSGLQSDRRGNTEYAAMNIWNKFIQGANQNIRIEKLKPNDSDYMSVWGGGSDEGSLISQEDRDGFMNYKFYNSDKTLLNKLIDNGNNLPKETKIKIIRECYEFYQSVAP
jgi:hypothetical protein